VANIKSAKKRAVQNEKRRIHNISLKSAYRTKVKKTEAAVKTGNKEEATQALKVCVPAVDKAAAKGLIHKNKAARYKSRLNKKLKALK
jgi:small subunit ribosomal protein S20